MVAREAPSQRRTNALSELRSENRSPPGELKRWHRAAGLTQREMAACLKLSAAYVAYLEKRSPITESGPAEALPKIHSKIGRSKKQRHALASP